MATEGASLSLLESIVQSQFTWALLCLMVVWVFYRKMENNSKDLKEENTRRELQIVSMYEEHKQEAGQREERLMTHLERTTDTLEMMEKNLQKLDEKMDKGFKDVWDHVKHPEPAIAWSGVERRKP